MRTRSPRIATALAAVAGLAAVVTVTGACGASSPAPQTSTAPAAVVIDTFMFGPRSLHIAAGTTVTWTNHDDIVHTVTSGTRTYDPANSGLVTATHPDGMFNTELAGRGATTHFTFAAAGTYHYFCNRHPGMEADVVVQ